MIVASLARTATWVPSTTVAPRSVNSEPIRAAVSFCTRLKVSVPSPAKEPWATAAPMPAATIRVLSRASTVTAPPLEVTMEVTMEALWRLWTDVPA